MHSDEFFQLQRAVAGRFSLVREIGRGGMGVVFAARDLTLERPVAIKLLPPALASSEELRRRFLREARTAAGLSHPHIVPIHSVEERDGLVYFVMALVEGESLGQRIRRAGPLPVAEAMRVVQETAWALGHAHARGVVHRDVKPDNILLDRDSGRVLVTDFGIAFAPGRDTPVDGVVVGTPSYMSPEQGRGEEPTSQSDLYALGVTAWMAVAGRGPFSGTDATTLLLQHASVPAPSLASARNGLPDTFVRAIDACLAKSPADRWESAEALAVALADERSKTAIVPAPVRAFLREWDGAGGEIGTAGTASVVAGLVSLAIQAAGTHSFNASILAVVYLLIAVLTGGLALERVGRLAMHARRLLRSGYDLRAVAQAMGRELPSRMEEDQAGTPDTARSTTATVAMGGAVSVGAFLLNWSTPDVGPFLPYVIAAVSVIAPTVTVRAAWSYWAKGRNESLWNRLGRGWLGRAIFRLAGVGIPAVATRALDDGEATVIVLGDEARRAFAALPAGQRAALHDVPSLVSQLEGEALRLRAAPPSPATASSRAQVMAALELLRLDLLKAGAAQLPAIELTDAIERVREIGRRVEGIVEAGDP